MALPYHGGDVCFSKKILSPILAVLVILPEGRAIKFLAAMSPAALFLPFQSLRFRALTSWIRQTAPLLSILLSSHVFLRCGNTF